MTKECSKDSGFELCAVGDIGLIGKVSEYITAHGKGHPFRHVSETLQKADLSFGNLEMPFSSSFNSHTSNEISRNFRVPPSYGGILSEAGFDVVSLANNHIMDCGVEGLRETLSTLQRCDVGYVGAGFSDSAARRPFIFAKNGVRLGLLAYATGRDWTAGENTPGAAALSVQSVLADIESLRARVDIVVISLHFGLMYVDYPSPQEQTMARSIINAGASLILGHHPHTLKGIEQYNGGIIAYSLGDFIFDPDAGLFSSNVANENRCQSMIFRCRIAKTGISDVELLPVIMNSEFQPVLAAGSMREVILGRLDELTAPLKDQLFDGQYYRHVGKKLLWYQVRGLFYHLFHLNLHIFLRQLSRVRGRHWKMLWGYVTQHMPLFRQKEL